MIAGRRSGPACAWFAAQPSGSCERIRWATLDLSAAYRTVFDTMLPHAVQVADRYHVVALANRAVDETRRRVQNETLGHRGRKPDPLYRIHRRLITGAERQEAKRPRRAARQQAGGVRMCSRADDQGPSAPPRAASAATDR